ncbi:mRNA capping enzyme, catalytic domain-containing protein [Mucor mucedo]|uniref:mRNA capping enzyme, catalytic domain-containing protein n=1 Tax=Mucor mucedo TaxID=29922 RepID=UPI00221FBB2C|nr:mRNA capping enzyme, catalytic domain-containing protein [Mucor mucedo]KAI7889738.1 mRNA capping enzyme, catalytic domain-containing protein [Mucor mucedo]
MIYSVKTISYVKNLMVYVIYCSFFIHLKYDRNKYWYYVPNLLFPLRGRDNEYLKDTLMDGELVLDIDQHKKTWRYLIFDLMVVNGSTIIQRSFSTRLGMLQQDVIHPFNVRMRTQTDPSNLPPFTVELKKMERSYGLHLVFEQIPKLKHKSDGIIWTPVKYPYTSGTCEKLLKWKPPELNTVDFRISAKWSKEHKPIYSIEVLSNGVTYKFYDHFQPEPALATQWKSQLPDGRIAEFRYDSDCEVTIIEQGYAPTVRKGGWRFVRFRDDKSTANDEMVVKRIRNSIQDGVTKEQLLLCMDRVRAAWKAREKGLPMPALHPKPTPLSLSHISPTSSALNTPTSNMLQSPSATPSGYFQREDAATGVISRSNSISEESPSTKRKSSITTPLNVESDDLAERKRLKPVDEEEEEEEGKDEKLKEEEVQEEKSIPVESNAPQASTQVIAPAVITTPITQPLAPAPVPPPTSQPPTNIIAQPGSPRRRKISIVKNDVKKVQTNESAEASPPVTEKKQRKANVSKRTASAPTVFIKQKERSPPLATSPKPLLPPPLDSHNRRSKSIPQQKEAKKMKPSSSSSIHNLLTTSVEPGTRAYNFSAILQKDDIPATVQPQQPVQFINFHAEGRNQATNNNHIMIIRSESHSQATPSPPPPPPPLIQAAHPPPLKPPPPQPTTQSAWKNNAFANHPYHPPYQQEYYQPYRQQQVAHEYQPQLQQQPSLPPQPQPVQRVQQIQPQQTQQTQQPQQQIQPLQRQRQPLPQPPKRKNSQKAKLDFILN